MLLILLTFELFKTFIFLFKGPYEEGIELEVSCVVGGAAKPAPSISWLVAGSEVEGQEVKEEEGVTRSSLSLILDRSHLGALLTCRSVKT
jgi:hypothetical protein